MNNNYSQMYNQASSMKAIGLTRLPKKEKVADLIELVEVPVPRPKDNEVAIKVFASTIHIDEINILQGTQVGAKFLQPKDVSKNNPHIIGSAVSGSSWLMGRI